GCVYRLFSQSPRLFLSQVLFRNSLVESIHEWPNRRIGGHLAIENLLRVYRGAIHLFVHALVHIQNRAVERNTREQSLGSRIGIDGRLQFCIDAGFSRPADGPGNHASVDTELQVLTAFEHAEPFAISEDQNEICRTNADLCTEAATTNFNKGW